MNRQDITIILLLLSGVLIPGCRLAGEQPVRTEAAAMISCEAALISIQAVPSERAEEE